MKVETKRNEQMSPLFTESPIKEMKNVILKRRFREV